VSKSKRRATDENAGLLPNTQKKRICSENNKDGATEKSRSIVGNSPLRRIARRRVQIQKTRARVSSSLRVIGGLCRGAKPAM